MGDFQLQSLEEEDPPWKTTPIFPQKWGFFQGGVLFLQALHLTQKENSPGEGGFLRSKYAATHYVASHSRTLWYILCVWVLHANMIYASTSCSDPAPVSVSVVLGVRVVLCWICEWCVYIWFRFTVSDVCAYDMIQSVYIWFSQIQHNTCVYIRFRSTHRICTFPLRVPVSDVCTYDSGPPTVYMPFQYVCLWVLCVHILNLITTGLE